MFSASLLLIKARLCSEFLLSRWLHSSASSLFSSFSSFLLLLLFFPSLFSSSSFLLLLLLLFFPSPPLLLLFFPPPLLLLRVFWVPTWTAPAPQVRHFGGNAIPWPERLQAHILPRGIVGSGGDEILIVFVWPCGCLNFPLSASAAKEVERLRLVCVLVWNLWDLSAPAGRPRCCREVSEQPGCSARCRPQGGSVYRQAASAV